MFELFIGCAVGMVLIGFLSGSIFITGLAILYWLAAIIYWYYEDNYWHYEEFDFDEED